MLAFSRKQIRHKPNLRYTDRGRPQNVQRFSFRVLNLGVRFAFATFDLLATGDFPVFLENQLRGVNEQRRYAASVFFLSCLNGMPNISNRSRASSLLFADVTIVMFIPCGRVNLSGFSSGNTNCSVKPSV